VIVRISSIAIPKIKLPDYFEHMQRELIPRYEGAPGLDSLHVLHRELVAYVEITLISLWDSEETWSVSLETRPFEHTSRKFGGIEFEPHTMQPSVDTSNTSARPFQGLHCLVLTIIALAAPVTLAVA
jgi:heme-degrading monooxygenase HmoA